jgi:hypothetical protein
MKKTMLQFSLVFVVAASLVACSKNEKSVPVRILLTDKPASFESVNVHIKGIQVKINNDEAAWIDIQTKDTTVNLLDLQNGVTMVLAQDNIPEGMLKEVRFILGDDNYVVSSGDTLNLKAPSASSSGLKVKIDKQLQTTMNTFTLDFDASLSIKEENGYYMLEPVIKLKP